MVCKHTLLYYAKMGMHKKAVRQSITEYVIGNISVQKQVRTNVGAGKKNNDKFG